MAVKAGWSGTTRPPRTTLTAVQAVEGQGRVEMPRLISIALDLGVFSMITLGIALCWRAIWFLITGG